MKILKTLFSGGSLSKVSVPPFDAPIRPDVPFYAIGDVHGEHGRLLAALSDIREKNENPMVVCVGDYVDRGEQSADVLRALKNRSDHYGESFVCLMGNHERMMINFLDDPEQHGKRWLRYGGLQTLASFGVSYEPNSHLVDLRDRFARTIGDGLIEWVRNLPTRWVSGNIAVVHAGADPNLPIQAQTRATLLWGHPEFAKVPRQDGMWVVHGHTIVDAPETKGGRIAIDTGAYATGRLTVAHIYDGDVDFTTF